MTWSFHDALIRVLNLFLAVVSFFLVLRFILRLLSANPSTPFVAWIYDVSNTLMSPFRGIFANPVVPSVNGQAVFDIVAIVALLFYSLLIYFLIALVDTATPDVVVHERRR
ncbi:MAG TPA: YggT family protein [Patescibacteria group bacterium]|nr:YggT family protein [Patescibacteria group bacterium]